MNATQYVHWFCVALRYINGKVDENSEGMEVNDLNEAFAHTYINMLGRI